MREQPIPTQNEILEVRERIKPFINPTPILSSSYLSSLISGQLYFKCENFQKTGSFKVRGAANTISQLQNPTVICAHSSGNHAQAVAYVGKTLKIPTKIVMPMDTPQVKKRAVKGYGAELYESGPKVSDQEAMSSKISRQQNATLIHPHNDMRVVAGAASIGLEIYEQHKDLDFIVFPIGGGGLASGTILATRYFSPNTQMIGVQPWLARDAYLSVQKGSMMPQLPPLTLAQGLRTGLGYLTFKILAKSITDVILVSEQEIIEAAKLFMERMKIVVELSGAVVLAAILKDTRFVGKKVCAIISGGNIDLSAFFDEKMKQASSLSSKPSLSQKPKL